MKYSYILLLIGASALPLILQCQPRVASPVSIGLLDEKVPAVVITTSAVFALSSSTGLFTGVIDLFPIVPHPDYADTFAIQSRPLQLQFKGQFPAGDISFLNSQNVERKYIMPCTCSVYDSVKSCQLNFSLVTPYDQPMSVAGSSIYQSVMDFVLVINPKDFGLQGQPFEIQKPILITTKNGIINKGY